MPFLVTDSAVPLPAETRPALKLTHHYDAPARGEVYAYLRCYVHKGALCYNLLVFDEAPPPSAHQYGPCSSSPALRFAAGAEKARTAA